MASPPSVTIRDLTGKYVMVCLSSQVAQRRDIDCSRTNLCLMTLMPCLPSRELDGSQGKPSSLQQLWYACQLVWLLLLQAFQEHIQRGGQN